MLKIRKFAQRITQYLIYGTIFLVICTACDPEEGSKPIWEYVDPLNQGLISRNESSQSELNPQAIPAIGTPFGMSHWTPETRDEGAACALPYHPNDTRIQGFRFTHITDQTCAQEYGSMTLMMKPGNMLKAPPSRSSTFAYKGQSNTPGYYGAELKDYGMLVEMTASDRVGFLQFRFSQKDTAYLFINTHNLQGNAQLNFYPHAGEIWVRDSIAPLYSNWTGSGAINTHYLIQVRKAIIDYGIWEAELIQPKETELRGSGEKKGFYLQFPVDSGETVQVKVGTSYWNNTAARLSLDTEIPHWDFDQVKGNTEKAWKELLEKLILEGNSATKSRFYTSLYHASIRPRLFSGVDGLYPAFAQDPFPFKMESGDFYGDLSMWNSLTDPHPQLLSLFFPNRMEDIKTSYNLLQTQADSISIFQKTKEHTQQENLANTASSTIFEILGLIPDEEDEGTFNIQTPLVESWTLALEKGNSFQVVVENFQKENGRIESVKLDGQALQKNQLTREEFHAGGRLEIVLE